MYRASRKKSKLSSLSLMVSILERVKGSRARAMKDPLTFFGVINYFYHSKSQDHRGLACARINQGLEIALTTLLSFCLEFWEGSSARDAVLTVDCNLIKKLCQLVAKHTQINFSFTTCDTHRYIWWLSFTCMGPIQNIHILFWNEVTNAVFFTNMLKIKILISIQDISNIFNWKFRRLFNLDFYSYIDRSPNISLEVCLIK